MRPPPRKSRACKTSSAGLNLCLNTCCCCVCYCCSVPICFVNGNECQDICPAVAVHAAMQSLLLGPLATHQATAPLDAVLLSLHGSFCAAGDDDVDGTVLAAVREIVGPRLHGHLLFVPPWIRPAPKSPNSDSVCWLQLLRGGCARPALQPLEHDGRQRLGAHSRATLRCCQCGAPSDGRLKRRCRPSGDLHRAYLPAHVEQHPSFQCCVSWSFFSVRIECVARLFSDMAVMAAKATALAATALRDGLQPVCRWVSLPLLWSAPRMITAQQPALGYVELLKRLDQRPGVLSCSVGTATNMGCHLLPLGASHY